MMLNKNLRFFGDKRRVLFTWTAHTLRAQQQTDVLVQTAPRTNYETRSIQTSYTEPEYEDSELNKFMANKTVPESGSLTVQNVQPNDSGIYSVQWVNTQCIKLREELYKNRCLKIWNYYWSTGGSVIQEMFCLPTVQNKWSCCMRYIMNGNESLSLSIFCISKACTVWVAYQF